MTANSLLAIAVAGGPRCCKRVSYLAILEAVKFLRKYLRINLPTADRLHCQFYKQNKECKYQACPFFPAQRQDKTSPINEKSLLSGLHA
jgi:hypothetical protein